ncbi:MAG: transglutaminase domain-containing protein [Clostridia bacterium]|nr:transglutaminase domain-containing protein [Clostridia bacterium]
MSENKIFKAGLPVLFVLLMWLLCCTVGHASSMDAVWPESPGIDVQSDGKLVIDESNMDKGYIMVRTSEPTGHAMKVTVSQGQWQLIYDLNSDAQYEVFPLQQGSGQYEIALFENVKGKKFSSEGKLVIDAQMSDEEAPFLVPNQYVSYELWTSAVQKSDEICAGMAPDQAFQAVSDFMASEFAYDFVRAKTISSGEKPDIDYCYDNRMGICQDLAAVTACMLRVQGVPARLVIGYADKYYHAWNTVVVNGEEVFFDPTHAVGAIDAKKYQTERMY